MKRVMTYGTLPTLKIFGYHWDAEIGAGTFNFGNDPRVGTCHLTKDQVWGEIQEAMYCDEIAHGEEWVAGVLYVLGIEWV